MLHLCSSTNGGRRGQRGGYVLGPGETLQGPLPTTLGALPIPRTHTTYTT